MYSICTHCYSRSVKFANARSRGTLTRMKDIRDTRNAQCAYVFLIACESAFIKRAFILTIYMHNKHNKIQIMSSSTKHLCQITFISFISFLWNRAVFASHWPLTEHAYVRWSSITRAGSWISRKRICTTTRSGTSCTARGKLIRWRRFYQRTGTPWSIRWPTNQPCLISITSNSFVLHFYYTIMQSHHAILFLHTCFLVTML